MPKPLEILNPAAAEVVNAYCRFDHTPGATVAVVVDDVGYHHSYGVASLKTGAPIAATTAFNIGSCSKAFVSAAVASLVAEGRASWDDPIAAYVPEFTLYDPEITAKASLRDLSGNRLGVPRSGLTEYGFRPSLSTEETLRRLEFTPPSDDFRTRFTYVNPGHTANALAVGRITGLGFLGALKERILDPLGMTTTSGGAATPRDLSDIAGWHCRVGQEIFPIEPVYTDNYLGGGGMAVSGADAVQWLRLQLGGGTVGGEEIIRRDAFKETHRPQIIAYPGVDIPSLLHPGANLGAYALGWMVSDLDGHPLIAHSGSDYGIASMTLLFPKEGVGLAIYTNINSRGVVATAYALAAALLGLPSRDWHAHFAGVLPAKKPRRPTIEATDLRPYAGVYAHRGDGPLRVELQEGRLSGVLEDGHEMSFGLAPVDTHAFELEFVSPAWRAMADGQGPTLVFTVEGGRATHAELRLIGSARSFARTPETASA